MANKLHSMESSAVILHELREIKQRISHIEKVVDPDVHLTPKEKILVAECFTKPNEFATLADIENARANNKKKSRKISK